MERASFNPDWILRLEQEPTQAGTVISAMRPWFSYVAYVHGSDLMTPSRGTEKNLAHVIGAIGKLGRGAMAQLFDTMIDCGVPPYTIARGVGQVSDAHPWVVDVALARLRRWKASAGREAMVFLAKEGVNRATRTGNFTLFGQMLQQPGLASLPIEVYLAAGVCADMKSVSGNLLLSAIYGIDKSIIAGHLGKRSEQATPELALERGLRVFDGLAAVGIRLDAPCGLVLGDAIDKDPRVLDAMGVCARIFKRGAERAVMSAIVIAAHRMTREQLPLEAVCLDQGLLSRLEEEPLLGVVLRRNALLAVVEAEAGADRAVRSRQM